MKIFFFSLQTKQTHISLRNLCSVNRFRPALPPAPPCTTAAPVTTPFYFKTSANFLVPLPQPRCGARVPASPPRPAPRWQQPPRRPAPHRGRWPTADRPHLNFSPAGTASLFSLSMLRSAPRRSRPDPAPAGWAPAYRRHSERGGNLSAVMPPLG